MQKTSQHRGMEILKIICLIFYFEFPFISTSSRWKAILENIINPFIFYFPTNYENTDEGASEAGFLIKLNLYWEQII